jgi:hypothetical protein
LLPDLQQRLSSQVGAFTGLYPLLGADEVSGEVVVDKSLSYILLLMVSNRCETGIIVHTVFFVFCLFLSFLVWNFLWLLEELLTLLCFFFILRMEISLFV